MRRGATDRPDGRAAADRAVLPRPVDLPLRGAYGRARPDGDRSGRDRPRRRRVGAGEGLGRGRRRGHHGRAGVRRPGRLHDGRARGGHRRRVHRGGRPGRLHRGRPQRRDRACGLRLRRRGHAHGDQRYGGDLQRWRVVGRVQRHVPGRGGRRGARAARRGRRRRPGGPPAGRRRGDLRRAGQRGRSLRRAGDAAGAVGRRRAERHGRRRRRRPARRQHGQHPELLPVGRLRGRRRLRLCRPGGPRRRGAGDRERGLPEPARHDGPGLGVGRRRWRLGDAAGERHDRPHRRPGPRGHRLARLRLPSRGERRRRDHGGGGARRGQRARQRHRPRRRPVPRHPHSAGRDRRRLHGGARGPALRPRAGLLGRGQLQLRGLRRGRSLRRRRAERHRHRGAVRGRSGRRRGALRRRRPRRHRRLHRPVPARDLRRRAVAGRRGGLRRRQPRGARRLHQRLRAHAVPHGQGDDARRQSGQLHRQRHQLRREPARVHPAVYRLGRPAGRGAEPDRRLPVRRRPQRPHGLPPPRRWHARHARRGQHQRREPQLGLLHARRALRARHLGDERRRLRRGLQHHVGRHPPRTRAGHVGARAGHRPHRVWRHHADPRPQRGLRRQQRGERPAHGD